MLWAVGGGCSLSRAAAAAALFQGSVAARRRGAGGVFGGAVQSQRLEGLQGCREGGPHRFQVGGIRQYSRVSVIGCGVMADIILSRLISPREAE
jgi:hypothetical protein